MSGSELVTVDHATTPLSPREMYRTATDVAGVCGDIVQRTAKKIQNKKYVCIEGWQAIATAHGCMLSIESVTEDAEGNVYSIASVRRMADGAILARAEGFVGVDESTWRSRARYARRAMAQTRAMSRAARSGFAHVVVLIDSGLSTTPFEEVGDSREEEPATTTPTIPFERFMEDLDAAFKARGFQPEQAEEAIGASLKQWNLQKLDQVPEAWRVTMIEAVRSGKADKFKKNGKAATANA